MYKPGFHGTFLYRQVHASHQLLEQKAKEARDKALSRVDICTKGLETQLEQQITSMKEVLASLVQLQRKLVRTRDSLSHNERVEINDVVKAVLQAKQKPALTAGAFRDLCEKAKPEVDESNESKYAIADAEDAKLCSEKELRAENAAERSGTDTFGESSDAERVAQVGLTEGNKTKWEKMKVEAEMSVVKTNNKTRTERGVDTASVATGEERGESETEARRGVDSASAMDKTEAERGVAKVSVETGEERGESETEARRGMDSASAMDETEAERGVAKVSVVTEAKGGVEKASDKTKAEWGVDKTEREIGVNKTETEKGFEKASDNTKLDAVGETHVGTENLRLGIQCDFRSINDVHIIRFLGCHRKGLTNQ